MHYNTKDLTGKLFGTLTPRKIKGRDNQGRIFWLCDCSCGNKKLVRSAHLIGGYVASCGCERYKKIAAKVTRHGHSAGGKVTPIYVSWAQMHARCSNPKHNRYHRYGGRGITICEEWKKFDAFLADMGKSWKPGLSIDRINNDGNYNPKNCRWSTPKQQAANRSKNVVAGG